MTRKHSSRHNANRERVTRGENSPAAEVNILSTHLRPLARCIRQASLPAGLLLSAGAVMAGPQGGNVVGGQGNISAPNASTTVINQQSHNLAIDWQSFNIAQHELVRFNQPSNNASALNRILDQNPSQIHGALRANGNVVLVNPNGVFFGPTATVKVGSLTASGMNIDSNDFMAGKHEFQNQFDEEGGLVVNQGLLEASTGGSINLIGGAVRNEGVILATAGQVNLVAGKKVTMDFDGDGLLQFAVDEEVLQNVHDLDDAISNTGEINADGGSVLLKGSAAKDVFSNVVNNSGVIKAGRIDNSGGTIRLIASGSGNSLINTGTLDASGQGGDGGTIKIYADDTAIVSGDSIVDVSSDSGNGGTVHVLGDKVGLFDHSSINASGATGGGEVLIGGDFQGKNADIKNVSYTYLGGDTSINVDATENGDGGRAIIWSDKTTRYYAEISARGGDESGDGGFVEVSGKETLVFRGTVDTTAANGENGTLLLDPTDLTITDGALDSGNADDEEIGGADGTLAFADGPATSTLAALNLEALANTTDISLQATNSITIDQLNGTGNDLTLTTDGFVEFRTGAGGFSMDAGDSITVTGTGTLSIDAIGASSGGTGDGTISVGSLATTGGGAAAADITLNGTAVTVNGTITTGASNITAVSSGAVDITASTGNVIINGGITTGSSTVATAGAGDTSSTGDITITASSGTVTGTGVLTTGDANVDGTDAGGGESATSGTISVTAGAGTPAIQLTGSMNTGNATLTNETGSDSATSGDVILTASGDIGTSTGTRQAVRIGNTITDNAGTLTPGTARFTATGSDIFISSDTNTLTISELVTANAQVDTIDILTSSGADVILTGLNGYTDIDTDIIAIDAAGSVFVTDTALSTNSLTINAADGVTVSANLTALSGIDIDADTDAGDNDGTLEVADGVTLDGTGTGFLGITANDVNLNTMGMLTSGASFVSITDSDGTGVGLGDTAVTNGVNISGAELQNITTSSNFSLNTDGNITVDNITEPNSDNIARVSLGANGTNSTLSFDNNASTFNGLTAQASDGITLNVNVTTETNTMVIEADTDANDDVGTFEIADGVTLDSSGFQILRIEADDFNLNTTGTINSGAASTTLLVSDAGSIDVGTDNGGDFVVEDGELLNISATGLIIGDNTNGNIVVDGVTGGSTTGLGQVSLNATQAGSSITFSGTFSDFNDGLAATTNDTAISVQANLQAGAGAVLLNAGTSTIDLGDGVNVNAIGAGNVLTLTAGGGIEGTGSNTLTGTDGVTLNNDYSRVVSSGADTLIINADLGDDGTGLLNAAGVNIDGSLGGGIVNLRGADIDFLSITGDSVRISSSNSRTIGVGDGAVAASDMDLSNAEIAGITATTQLTIGGGDGDSGSITVDGISGTDSNNIALFIIDADSNANDTTVTFSGTASVFNALTVDADEGVTVSVDVSTDTGGIVINANTDGDATGTLLVDSGAAIDTSATAVAMDITAEDIDLSAGAAGASLVSGTGGVFITESNGAGIGLGGTALGLHLDSTDLTNISSTGGLFLDTAGAVTVNGLSATNTANIGTTIDIDVSAGAGDINFSTASSVLANNLDLDLTLNASNLNINAGADLTLSGTGGVKVTAAGGTMTVNDTITVGSNGLDVDPPQTVDINADISSTGDILILATDNITIDANVDSVGSGGIVTIHANSDAGDGVGDVTIGGTATARVSAVDADVTLTGENIIVGNAGNTSTVTTGDTGTVIFNADFENSGVGDVTIGANAVITTTAGAANGGITINASSNNVTIANGATFNAQGDVLIDDAAIVDIDAASLNASAGLTISNVTTRIDLGTSVALVATNGTVDLNNAVAQIRLDGTAQNTITVGADVELADVIDSANVTELEINADDNITLADITLDNTTTVILDVNLDVDGGGALLSSPGNVLAGSIAIDGTGADDTMTFDATGAGSTISLESTGGSIVINQADQVNFIAQGGANANQLTAETDFTISNVGTEVDFQTTGTFIATFQAEDGNINIDNTAAIDLSGDGGQIQLHADEGAASAGAGTGNISIGDVATSGTNGSGLELRGDGDTFAFGTIDLNGVNNGDLRIFVDRGVGAGSAADTVTLNINGADFTNIGSLTIASQAAGANTGGDTFNLTGDISAEAVFIDQVQTIDLAQNVDITATDGQVSMTTLVGTINLSGSGGTNVIQAEEGGLGNGNVMLGIIDATAAVAANLTINADGDTLSFGSLDLGGGTSDGAFSANIDQTNGAGAANDAATLSIVGSPIMNVESVTLTAGGVGGGDTIRLLTTSSITANSFITINDVQTLELDAGQTHSTVNGDIDMQTNVGGIVLNGNGGLITLDAGNGAAGNSNILVADISTDGAGNGTSLTLTADGGVTLGASLDLDGTTDGDLIIEVDANDNDAATLTIPAGITNTNTVTLTGGATQTGANIDTLAGGAVYSVTGANAGTVDGFNFTQFGNLSAGPAGAMFTVTATGTINDLTGTGGQMDTFILQNTAASVNNIVGQATDGDAIDISGLAGAHTVDLQAGTVSTVQTGTFSNIEDFTGDGAADTLTGRNVANTWALDGTPTYFDGTTTINFTAFTTLQGGTNTDAFNITAASTFNLLGGAGVDTFDVDATLTGSIDGEVGADVLLGDLIDAVVLTGSDANGFDGTEADITGGFDGISDITGNGGTLTGQNVASTWALNATPTYDDGSGNPVLSFNTGGFANLQGGTNTDAFNITAASTFNLLGGAGVDTFDVDATLTGSIDGEVGADVLLGDLIDAVVLTGSDANGFDGTEADITGGFDGISDITGNGGTLTGQNVASTWDLDATPTYFNGTHTLAIAGFANLQGGTNTDAFNVITANTFNLLGGAGVDTFDVDATLTGSIDGEVGADVLLGDLIDAVVLTGSDGDGFAGTEGDITLGFDGIQDITGNGGTLTGQNVASTWTINGASSTYFNGTHTLDIDGFANLQGGTNTDAFNITAASTFNLLGGTGVDTFDVDATLTGSLDGEAGVDILQGTTINNVVLTGSNANGHAGTETDVSAGFAGIQTLTGAGGGTLTGQNVASTWALNATPTYDDGSGNPVLSFNTGGFANLQGGTNTDAFNVSAASVFNLNGGNGTDTFTFTGAGTLTGNIVGSGATNDEIDISTIAGAHTINLQAGTISGGLLTGTFTTVESFTGDGAADTLIGTDVATVWSITGVGDGTTNTGFIFTDMFNLTGGTNTDDFQFANAGSVGGNIVGSGGNDTITGDADGNAFVVTGADTGTEAAKIGGTWAAENLTGGAAADSFTFNGAGSLSGTASGVGGADTFDFDGGTANAISGGTGNDVFDYSGGTAGNITLTAVVAGNGFSGNDTGSNVTTTFTGIGTIIGTVTTDLTGLNAVSTFNVNGGNDTYISGGETLTLSNFANFTGGSAADTFEINGAHTGNLTAGSGDDIFNLNGGTLTGNIAGGAGTDIINNGTTYNINGTDTGTVTNVTGVWSAVENLTGTAAADTFNFNGGTLSGTADGLAGNDLFDFNGGSAADIDGGAGTDSLDFAGAVAQTVTLSGPGTTDGFMGNTGLVTNFDNINNVVGSGGTDVLVGADAAATWAIGAADVYTASTGQQLTFSAIENFTGGAAVDTFNFTTSHSSVINGGGGNDDFNFNGGNISGTITGNAGENIYDFNGGTLSSTVTITGDDFWDHANGITLGAVCLVTEPYEPETWPTGDLEIGAAGLNLPTMTGFTGHFIIGGDITLLGQNVDLLQPGNQGNPSLSAGGIGGNQVVIIAAGDGANGGDITGSVTDTFNIQGGSAVLIATNNIVNGNNIQLELGNGDLVVSIGPGQEAPTFGLLDANVTDATNDLSNFLNFANVNIGAISVAGFNVEVNLDVSQANLAGNLIGLEQLAFIDVGLFEEDLSLFGVIGNGVALSLAQCEEVEGCAPDVSESELDELIAGLNARIDELEKRLDDATGAERAQIEELLDGYRAELSNFESYKQQLEEYYSGDDDYDELDDDGFGDEGPSVGDQIQSLSEVLEVAQGRIEWLESLKSDADARASLSERTGIDLTIEAIDEIINATQQEIIYIERQIQLLQEGTEAMAQPIFWAEAGDYNSIHEVAYGSSLFSIGVDTLAHNQWH